MRHSLRPLAVADIRQIWEQGAAQFGITHADAYAAGLDRLFDMLSDFPRAARLREELNEPVRAFNYRAHVVIYEIGPDDAVTVLRVRHSREDWISDPL